MALVFLLIMTDESHVSHSDNSVNEEEEVKSAVETRTMRESARLLNVHAGSNTLMY